MGLARNRSFGRIICEMLLCKEELEWGQNKSRHGCSIRANLALCSCAFANPCQRMPKVHGAPGILRSLSVRHRLDASSDLAC